MLKKFFVYRHIFQNYLIPVRPVTGPHARTQFRKFLTILNNTLFLTSSTSRTSKPYLRPHSCRQKNSTRYFMKEKRGKNRGDLCRDGAGHRVTWRSSFAAMAPKARWGAMTASSTGMLPAWPKEAQNPKNSQYTNMSPRPTATMEVR